MKIKVTLKHKGDFINATKRKVTATHMGKKGKSQLKITKPIYGNFMKVYLKKQIENYVLSAWLVDA